LNVIDRMNSRLTICSEEHGAANNAKNITTNPGLVYVAHKDKLALTD
jgi:hypothetical protein